MPSVFSHYLMIEMSDGNIKNSSINFKSSATSSVPLKLNLDRSLLSNGFRKFVFQISVQPVLFPVQRVYTYLYRSAEAYNGSND